MPGISAGLRFPAFRELTPPFGLGRLPLGLHRFAELRCAAGGGARKAASRDVGWPATAKPL